MRLTLKDKRFIKELKALCERNELEVRIKGESPLRFVLCHNYGDKIHKHFEMTRQGVRWRFMRIFNEVYVSAYEVIYWIESSFGTSLRKGAIAIVKERVKSRRKLQKMSKS